MYTFTFVRHEQVSPCLKFVLKKITTIVKDKIVFYGSLQTSMYMLRFTVEFAPV